MEVHEYAKLFPPMSNEEFEELVEDIRQNGQLEPIIVYEGKILDGRNRYNACMKLGIKPKMVDYNGENLTPLNFVISKNIKRRHLTASQKALLALEIKPLLAEEAKKRQLSSLKQYKENTVQEIIPEREEKKENGDTVVPLLAQREKGRTIEQAGKIIGVGKEYIRKAEKVKKEAPELVEKIMAGEMNLNQAVKEVKRKQVLEHIQNIESKGVEEIDGVYDVIVIDPPWPSNKIERDVTPEQVEFDYPTMSIEEIKALEIPCADNCHVWLWTTQKYLPVAFDVLKAWGLKYVCTFVWHKPGGFQPFDLPQYNCEFALYARKGTPFFTDLKDFKTCFTAPRGKHSEKPQEFYELVKRVTTGKRLDMFNRKPIDGFDSWGKEASK